ncbi:hypothetical protein Taro_032581 [Colocasia esculenta]|uniref:Alpha-1,3-glucosyltransferase n=1 Tax=Colocasia esculenta TaxID=4460 RepID=A0A843W2B1_COLES|nr:hypothetical protein [Colocasia esculenta]
MGSGRRRKPPPPEKMEEETPLPIWWRASTPAGAGALAAALVALLVRLLVSLGPYSGRGRPPMYGDYEAQRHWMEITLHTPPSEWYRNTSANDLAYWGLDYPPLTAYQSYAHGRLFLQPFAPDSVALLSSRGYETPGSKLLMRWTVLSSDLLVFFPAALYFVYVYCCRQKRGCEGDGTLEWQWLLAMILLNPCLILIDHGHFQYNCISLGFTVGAVAAILAGRELFGSFLFCLALNHKQMSAYFAPAFLGHLFGKCLKRRNPIFQVLRLGIVVLATFAIAWWPYLYSLRAVFEVLSRLAPFERGIYEDYVANFWCSTSIVIKWKKIFTIKSLKFFSSFATVSSLLPSMVQQIKSPSDRGFLYSLLNSSFSFYLFSYQVHEKSILLPLIPASLLALEEPTAFGWFTYYALFSMLPLLHRDGLILQYGALLALFALVYCLLDERHRKEPLMSGKIKLLILLPFLYSVLLHHVYLNLRPSGRYPFLFEALIMILCFSQFVILALYTNIKQWMLPDSPAGIPIEKKDL